MTISYRNATSRAFGPLKRRKTGADVRTSIVIPGTARNDSPRRRGSILSKQESQDLTQSQCARNTDFGHSAWVPAGAGTTG
jgi:hypothetical protein